MRSDDLNATVWIRTYYRNTYGREASPSDISSWLNKRLTEMDAMDAELDAKTSTTPTPQPSRAAARMAARLK